MRGSAVSNGTSAETEHASASLHGISRDDLLRAYRMMVLSRRLDDKEIQLKGQSLIFFQISGAGHEAILTAAGMLLKPAYDWFYPYYRDRALCLALGVTAARHAARGRRRRRTIPRPAGGRCRRTGAIKLSEHRLESSPTGTQCLQAIGCAEAGRLYERVTDIPDREERFQPDEITYVSLGEGTTSEGEFWESLNAACLTRLPVIFLVEDNGYAISVPVDVQTAGRRHLEAGRVVSRPPRPQHRRHRLPRQLPHHAAKPSPTCGRGADRRSCTRTSPARTPTRCRTTSGCTRRPKSGPRRRCAIRSSGSASC